MYVQEYLKGASEYCCTKEEALSELEKDFGIKSKIYDDFVVLNYSQIDSPKTDPIVLECRGLILDWDWNVLRRPFDRFFNYGEADNQDFDFKNSVCMEKLDGSLIPAWWNPFEKRWCFGTRGTAFAECECNSGRMFFEIIDDCFMTDSKESVADTIFYEDQTYIFELCSPENRVVVPYSETSLVLIGVRDNDTGDYFSIKECEEVVDALKIHDVKVRMPNTYNLHELDSIHKSLEDTGIKLEGYVFWNPETNERVKIKSIQYVAIHHLRDNGNLNPKRICELVFANETSEYLQYFESDKKFFDPWIDAYGVMVEAIHFYYEVISKYELTQKEYAMLVKDSPYSGIMFALRQGKSLEDCFAKMNSDAKVRLLEHFKE